LGRALTHFASAFFRIFQRHNRLFRGILPQRAASSRQIAFDESGDEWFDNPKPFAAAGGTSVSKRKPLPRARFMLS
jgi:hypothetical protein